MSDNEQKYEEDNPDAVQPAQEDDQTLSEATEVEENDAVFVVTTSRMNIIDEPSQQPPTYLGLAAFSCLLNPLFAIVATIFSRDSDFDYKNGRIKAASLKGRISRIISVTGIILSILTFITVLVLYLNNPPLFGDYTTSIIG